MPKSREEVEHFSEALLKQRDALKSIIANFLEVHRDNFYSLDEIVNIVDEYENWEGIALTRVVASALSNMEMHGVILAEYIDGNTYYAWK